MAETKKVVDFDNRKLRSFLAATHAVELRQDGRRRHRVFRRKQAAPEPRRAVWQEALLLVRMDRSGPRPAPGCHAHLATDQKFSEYLP